MHEILSQTLGQQIPHFVRSALQQRHEYGMEWNGMEWNGMEWNKKSYDASDFD